MMVLTGKFDDGVVQKYDVDVRYDDGVDGNV